MEYHFVDHSAEISTHVVPLVCMKLRESMFPLREENNISWAMGKKCIIGQIYISHDFDEYIILNDEDRIYTSDLICH